MIDWWILSILLQLTYPWTPSQQSRLSMSADCWIFDSDAPRGVSSTGDHGNLYEVPLQPCTTQAPVRPGECREFMSCRLGSFNVMPCLSLMVCWHRFKVWWMRPVFGDRVPPETIMMLFQDTQQHYRLVIAGDASVACSLKQQDEDGVIITSTDSNIARLYCGMGKDPYALIRDGMKQVTGESTVTKKRYRTFSLGWCTWNAFYTQMSGPKLVQQVETLLETAPVKWMILDDGWQHTTNDDAQNGQQWKERLESLQESPSKFKDLSLRDTIAQIKSLGIQDVWVWHTLMGYWLGVSHDARLMYPHFSSGILDNDGAASREASVEEGIGIPQDSSKFFGTYHDYLKKCGISGVKVDAQGVVGTLRPYKWDEASKADGASGGDSVVSELHQALAASVKSHFGPQQNILHCMSHAPKVIFRLGSLYDELPLMRASDDHYPNNPYSHGPHVVACAFNSLLLSQVAVPDWDMFTTDLPDERTVRLHAVSRCLSGGPVYISDPPSCVKHEVVTWTCCTDGTVLPCRQAALPVARCLLTDPLERDSDPFVIFNTNGSDDCVTSGVFGVFHLAGSGSWDYAKLDYGPLDSTRGPSPSRGTARVRPADIPNLDQHVKNGVGFLALPFFSSERAVVLPVADSEFSLDLEPLECDAITVLPIHLLGSSHEIVILGIEGKINGAGSVLSAHVNDSSATIKARGSGKFQFGIRPAAAPLVRVNDAYQDADDAKSDIVGFSIYFIDLDTGDEDRKIEISIPCS